MHDQRLSIFFSLLIILLIAACADSSDEDLTSSEIDPTFQTYVDNFFVEAEKRGQDLSSQRGRFSVQFGDLGGILANGLCRTRSKEVLIHRNRWLELGDRQKERLIFHELGHCLLNRPHRDDILPNGECRSMMRGGDGESCFSNVVSDIWQSYYYDELFRQDTDIPSWYKEDIIVEVTSTLFDESVEQANFLNYRPDIILEEYSIVATFQYWRQSPSVQLLWDDFELLTNSVLTGIKYQNEFIYFKRDLVLPNTITLGHVVKDGFIYFMLNGEIFHTMETLNKPTFFSLMVDNIGNSSVKIPLQLEVQVIQ